MRIEEESFAEMAKEMRAVKSNWIEWNKKSNIRAAIDEGKACAINESSNSISIKEGASPKISALIIKENQR